MMKNTIIIAGVSATLAFSAAWLIKPDVTADEHDQEVNASKQTSRSSRASKASPSVKPPPRGRHRSAEMVEEENSIEALDLETQKQMELAEEKQRKMLRDQVGGGAFAST